MEHLNSAYMRILIINYFFWKSEAINHQNLIFFFKLFIMQKLISQKNIAFCY
jgi:hypothetical protein